MTNILYELMIMSVEAWGKFCFQMSEQIFNAINVPLIQNEVDYVCLYYASW